MVVHARICAPPHILIFWFGAHEGIQIYRLTELAACLCTQSLCFIGRFSAAGPWVKKLIIHHKAQAFGHCHLQSKNVKQVLHR